MMVNTISNPYFHRSQVAQIAIQCSSIHNIENLKNLNWIADGSIDFPVFSKLQSSQIVNNP
jgi:hypothetical protein